MNGPGGAGIMDGRMGTYIGKLVSLARSGAAGLSSLPKREQTTLAVGGIVAAAILGYVYLLEPLFVSYDSMEVEAGRIADRIDRYKSVVDSTEDNRARNRELIDSYSAIASRCFTGKTEEIAAGQLADLASRKASEAGVSLKSTRVEKSRVIPGFRQVGVSVVFEGPTSGLVRFIQSVEQDPMKIVIAEARIHSQKERYDLNQEEKLTVEMTLSGLKQLQ